MATVEILTIPLGSHLTSRINKSIDPPEPDSKNDIPVLLLWDEPVDLTQSHVSVSAGSSIVAFDGANNVFQIWVRPPETTGIVRVTVAVNAVSQGNPQTHKDIRVTRFFPDADAEAPTLLFNHNLSYSYWLNQGATGRGIACSPSRIIISSSGDLSANNLRNSIDFFTYSGTHESAETITIAGGYTFGLGKIDFINGDLLYQHTRFSATGSGRLDLQTLDWKGIPVGVSVNAITHTRLGITVPGTSSVVTQPYDPNAAAVTEDFSLAFTNQLRAIGGAAHQNDLIYIYDHDPNKSNTFPGVSFLILQITGEDEFKVLASLNIARASNNSTWRDIAIYRDTLYLLDSAGVYTLDIRKYRPTGKNTKTTIYPVFIDEGGTLDLTQFAPDAERIVWDVGTKIPDFLSINANNELVVANQAVTETTPVFLPLLAINRIDSQPFGFYLVIEKATNPVVRDVSELAMRANSTYDLFQLTDADEITFRSGRRQPTDSSLSNGVFRIGTVGGRASFTARKGGRSTHFEIEIVLVQESDPANFSDDFRHRVEIAGIDVTADANFPTISTSLDAISLNEYKPNEVELTLKSSNLNNYKYNDGIPDNFWETNGLNPAGFQEPIKIFIESRVNGNYISHLLFSGVILLNEATLNQMTVRLTCTDISQLLHNTLVQDFGTLEKWDSPRRQSDEASYEGVYVPDRSFPPMQIGTGKAWHNQKKLEISKLALPSEGVPPENTAYLTATDFRVAGGFLPKNPMIQFKTQHLSEDIRFLVNQLALNKVVYNTEIDLPAVTLETPFLLNRGSVSFSVENTRITRLLTDWVYDSTQQRLLTLLSNPEAHIADLLVQYNLSSDSYRVLHVFDKSIKVHRIARRNSTNYYLLTSAPITQDRSASALPRPMDSTGYAYDSASEQSVIRIHRYNANTNTLTEHVAEDNARPPQLGIHYWVGFENDLYIDEFEGIVPYDRGAFKVHGNNLYYRYATASEFGVARVNTAGTTSEMIDQPRGDYHNHLNFAFDINTSGTIYFVYADGDAHTGTLTIKRRTSGGTESTILTDTQSVGEGAYLGAYETLFHNNYLYILAPVQSADFGEDATLTNAYPDFIIEGADTSESRYVTTSTNLNPTSTRLAPGDDIPIRIDFNSTISGATQSDLTVYGGTLQSFSISSDMIDVTIRPDDPTRHKNIVIDLAEDAVSQGNSATRIVVDFGTRRSREKSAKMTLYRCNVTAGTPTLDIIETYDFVQLGACNLTVHDGAVHFIENSPASQMFKSINPDLDGYWTDADETETMGYNIVPESLGALKKINSSGEVENLGNLQYTDRPYNIAAARCLSLDDDLHIAMGYGNLNELLRFNSLASQAENVQHLVYGKKLQYIIPKFDINGSRYTLLADIAKKVNATLIFNNDIITLRDRNPYLAQCDGTTGIGTGNLSFDRQNKEFPESGYLRIRNEILGYTGITSGAFTGVSRGILGTQISNHPNDSVILYLNNVLQRERIKGRISMETDTTRIYNAIRNNANTAEESDDDSITAYNERPYTLELGLTRHELPWQNHAFDNYLQNLKDLRQLIRLTLQPTKYLEAGQFVGFKYESLVYAMQIVSTTKSLESTEIQGRTL